MKKRPGMAHFFKKSGWKWFQLMWVPATVDSLRFVSTSGASVWADAVLNKQ